MLTDLGYIERLGYGIDRMMAAMQEAGLPEPEFEETRPVSVSRCAQPATTW